jgi:hypothetical protein
MPVVQVLTPAHFAIQAFPYVLPSHPQTGKYCCVQIQSEIAVPLQLPEKFFTQEEKMEVVKIKIAPTTIFIRNNLRVNKITLFI